MKASWIARIGLATLSLFALTACQGPTPTPAQETPAESQSRSEKRQESSSPQATDQQTEKTENRQVEASAAGKNCPDNQACTSLLFAGDLLVHPLLWAQAQKDAQTAGQSGLDFAPLIAEQKPYTDRADLAVCQMETIVADPAGPYSGYPNFNVPPQILTAAAQTGWDVCLTASNHAFDRGTQGLERTYRSIQDSGMGVTGTNLSAQEASQPDIFTSANGIKIAIISGTYALNGQTPDQPWQVDLLEPQTMIAKAQAARQQGADLVIANMHAGDEYVHQPNSQQKEVAHALVDSGAFDLIVGQHAHVVQPIEKYKDTWIVYGLGNNITELSPVYPANNEGIMVNAVFTQQADGQWEVHDLRWVSSKIVDQPDYRYCITSPSRPSSNCIDPAEAEASNARVQEIVESMGAAQAGARQWS